MALWSAALSSTGGRFVTRAGDEPFATAAVVIASASTLTLAGAWIFQYGMGLAPCPLCLEQRYAYYFAIPVAAMVMLGLSVGSSRKVFTLAFLAIGAALLWNAGLGAYHAGVEWHWWAGPQDCAAASPSGSFGPASGLLEQMQTQRVVRCDEAAWRFLGLSLAGYNVLISLALAAVAGFGAATSWREHKRIEAAEAAEDDAR